MKRFFIYKKYTKPDLSLVNNILFIVFKFFLHALNSYLMRDSLNVEEVSRYLYCRNLTNVSIKIWLEMV